MSGSKPVAQAIVLRRVLMGGISTNRCLVARTIDQYGFLRGFRNVVWSGVPGSVWHTVGS